MSLPGDRCKMMQLDTVERLFSVKQLIADNISLFVFCSSPVEHVCRYSIIHCCLKSYPNTWQDFTSFSCMELPGFPPDRLTSWRIYHWTVLLVLNHNRSDRTCHPGANTHNQAQR